MKTTSKTICAIMFNLLMGALFAVLLGVPIVAGMLFMVVIGTVMSFAPAPKCALRAGVYDGQVSLSRHSASSLPVRGLRVFPTSLP